MEIDAAFGAIDEEFTAVVPTSRPYKKGLKSSGSRQLIELAFITPDIGIGHAEKLERLAVKIGWDLGIKPEPNQVAVVEVLEQLIPPAWGMTGRTSFHKGERTVRIKCAHAPAMDDPERTAVQERLRQLTGYSLEI